jgi:hypothetical protein
MFFRFNPINMLKKMVNTHKDKINNMIMYVSYNLIYYITGVQILCNKLYKRIQPFVLFIYSYTKPKNETNIKFIKNGNVIISNCKENIKNNILDCRNKNVKFDFILYSDLTNKVIYNILPLNYNYSILSYKFLNTELITKSKKKINLSFVTSDYNYFIENNIINKPFMLYFIKTHYNEFNSTLPPDDLNEYTMIIIDDKINIIEVSSLNAILFKKEAILII